MAHPAQSMDTSAPDAWAQSRLRPSSSLTRSLARFNLGDLDRARGIQPGRVAGRYGSGAGRTRSRDRADFRFGEPAGPQTAADWGQALEHCTNRIDTAERAGRKYASDIANIMDKVNDINNRVVAQETRGSHFRDQATQDRAQIQTLGSNIQNLGTNIEEKLKQYTTVTSSKLLVAELEAKMDTLQISLQFIQESVDNEMKAGKTQDEPTTGPEQFNMESPVRQQGDDNPIGTLCPPILPGQTADPMTADDAWGRAKVRSQTITHSPFVAANAASYGGDSLDSRHGAAQERRHVSALQQGTHNPSPLQPSPNSQPPGLAAGALGMMNVRMGRSDEGAMGCQKLMNKGSDKLKMFSGSPLDFDNWAKSFIHHMSKVQVHWRYLLGWLSTYDGDLTLDYLITQSIGPYNEPAEDLAVKLESTLMDYLPVSLTNRRVQLAGGPAQECNGFAIWRRLHRENKGSGDAVEYAGVEALKEYSRCDRLADLSGHMDNWLDMLGRYGAELQFAPRMVRSMFLDIIPRDLKQEIMKKKRLREASHLELMDYCRNKCELLMTENLVDVERKNLSREFNLRRGGKVHAVKESEECAPSSPEMQQVQKAISKLTDLMIAQTGLSQPINAVKPPPPPNGTRDRGRDRERRERDRKSPRQSPGRSKSPSRFFLEGWGKRCNHCGSDKHLKRDCKEFDEMMKKANVGVSKDKWKPPVGYKSALGRARDAARNKSPGKVAAITADNEDTASESDFSDSDSVNFSIKAMRPVKNGTPMKKARISAITHAAKKDQCPVANQFQAFNNESNLDQETVDSLNSWANSVKTTKHEPQTIRKIRSKLVVVKTMKDLDKLDGKMAALSLDNKSLSRSVKKILKNMRVECENDEVLAMIDSGSFTHAANAEVHLPGHEILPPGPKEKRRKAETACGGLLDIKGLVDVEAEVNGHSLGIKFCHMDVNTPIISVRKLVKDGYDIFICEGGGFIRHMATGKRLYFLEHQGVYYIKLKIKSAGFGRPGM